jgi:phosphatidate cytidylyltransferase
MKRVATAVVLIPLVLLAVLKAPTWLLALIVCLIAVLATREYLALVKGYGLVPFARSVYSFLGVVFGAIGLSSIVSYRTDFVPVMLLGDVHFPQPPRFLILILLIALAWMLLMALDEPDLSKALPSAAASFLALPYITLPLAGLVSLRAGRDWFVVLYLLVVVWAGDIFAYYVGKTIGRHKLAPRISPGKTWEGAVASFVGATAVGTAMFLYQNTIASALHRAGLVGVFEPSFTMPIRAAGLSALVNVAAQIGDLAESMMKRGAGAKDSGVLLPGHGGVLDRIDALLFAVPVVWYYAAIVLASATF